MIYGRFCRLHGPRRKADDGRAGEIDTKIVVFDIAVSGWAWRQDSFIIIGSAPYQSAASPLIRYDAWLIEAMAIAYALAIWDCLNKINISKRRKSL